MDFDNVLDPELNSLTEIVNGTDSVDGKVNNWFLMEKPWLMLTIISAYLYFVLKLGPKLMKERKAFNLKLPLLMYNCLQVVFSSWWIYKVIGDSYMQHFLHSACHPTSKDVDSAVETGFHSMAWYYMMAKVVELLDTIFFVLRKKQNQISFLHLYHHTVMVAASWVFLKYFRGSHILMIGVLNSAVHVVMYSYYLLAAMGPRVQKYLWWKRYITSIQLLQFVLVILYLVCLLYLNCEVPRPFAIFSIGNSSVLLLLFGNFYYNTYAKKLL